MSAPLVVLPPVNGGEEKTYFICLIDEANKPLDLTGATITAEVAWDDARGRDDYGVYACSSPQIALRLGDGLTVLDLAPDIPVSPAVIPDPQFSVTLSEQRTRSLPEGRRAYMKFIVVMPGDVTSIFGPYHLERIK